MEQSSMWNSTRNSNRRSCSGKCFVCVLASFVMVCAVVLISASVLRVKKPHVKLTSATSNQINYTASPSINATIIIFFTINNPNFGPFNYDNTSLTVLYAGGYVGNGKINGGRVSLRQAKQIYFTVNLRVPVTANSGSLNLTTHAKFGGTVDLLKIINVRKTVEMGCGMNLNLTSHAVEGIQCPSTFTSSPL